MARPGDVPGVSSRGSLAARLRDRLPAGALEAPAGPTARLRPAPVACALPADPQAVGVLLAAARAERAPVVVVGEGSRLGSGAGLPAGGYLALSSARLSGVLESEPGSLWLRAGAGTPLRELAARAAELGLRPVGVEPDDPGSLGGFLARTARVADPITGLDQPAALSVEGLLADGTPIASLAAPRSACGPEYASLLLGHGGAFGVITAARVKLEPLPERRLVLGLTFVDPAAALELFRALPLHDFPPRRAELELAPGREARLLVCLEGDAELAGRALADVRRAGEAQGGQGEELEQARGWLGGAGAPDGLEAWVSHGAVARGLASGLAAPFGLAGPALVRLDRPGLNGCRLRLAAPRAGGPDRLRRALDPEGREARAAADERELLGRLRARLDPDGLLNPQALPGPGAGGGP
ncbi:MAG TPA: FAD-binding protein [Myxococcota bacterium]|nr:FAD-binding protein [Myxococcota bacterium]HRY96418.1 FAD-binding protein [Myxococcota bacterium]HSA21771.1 FAD-binding protein [Myxococcota bacterium]